MLAEHTYCFITHIKNLEKTCQQHIVCFETLNWTWKLPSIHILLINVVGNVGSINCSHTVCTQFAPPLFSIFKTHNSGFKFLLLLTSKPSESCDCPQIAWDNANTELLGFKVQTLRRLQSHICNTNHCENPETVKPSFNWSRYVTLPRWEELIANNYEIELKVDLSKTRKISLGRKWKQKCIQVLTEASSAQVIPNNDAPLPLQMNRLPESFVSKTFQPNKKKSNSVTAKEFVKNLA